MKGEVGETPGPVVAAEAQAPARNRHSAHPAEGEGCWQRLARMSEADWASHVIYCYRLAPKIDAGSDRHFIAKYQRAIDEADLLADHGSGRYLLVLNDTKARKNHRSCHRHRLQRSSPAPGAPRADHRRARERTLAPLG